MRVTRFPAQVLAWLLLSLCVCVLVGCGSGEYKADISKTPPPNSLVIFNFAPSGDADAKFYGYGFAGALRIHLASACSALVIEVSPYGSESPLVKQFYNPAHKPTDQQAIKVTRTMGARYAAVGSLSCSGDTVKIGVRLLDIQSPDKVKTLSASGRKADLPNMQAELTRQLVSAMGLRPDSTQSKALAEANFTKPEVLVHITKALLANGAKASESGLWQAYDVDSGSRLATSVLIRHYGDVRTKEWKDLAHNRRLQKLISEAQSRYPGDSDIMGDLSLILVGQYRYAAAEELLKKALEKEPKSVYLHSYLSYVAMCRLDTELAVKEAQAAVLLWPSDPIVHAGLAESLSARAAFARQRHDPDKLTTARRREWETDNQAALAEAYAALKTCPDSSRARYVVMLRSLDTGRSADARKAFDALVRIVPKQGRTYLDYMEGLTHISGSDAETQRVLKLADKNLSPQDALTLRGWAIVRHKPANGKPADVVLMADKALSMPGKPTLYPLFLKRSAYEALGRHDQALRVARKGHTEDPSPTWKRLLSYDLLVSGRKTNDRVALNQAAKLLTDYLREVPYDPTVHRDLADCYWHLGDRETALAESARAVELDPSDREMARWVIRTKVWKWFGRP